MMEDNTIFEWFLHLTELGVVVGIGAVVWYTKRISSQRKKEETHEN